MEFALVAPLLLTALFGLIEGGRAIWTKQALQQVAAAGARCLALGTQCTSVASARTFTVRQGEDAGMPLATGHITATQSTTCSSQANMSKVEIRMPFNTVAAGFLPFDFTTMNASACFPRMTS